MIGTTISGDVPQVTCGSISWPFKITVRSNLASSSEISSFQASVASAHILPTGAKGLPSMYLKVFSSTAIRPARAPASIAILQTVILPSTERARITSPANSIVNPVPPAVPISPITASTTSLAVTPLLREPSILTSIFFIFFCIRHCVASTCSTSDVPIPCARAPKAPCVDV